MCWPVGKQAVAEAVGGDGADQFFCLAEMPAGILPGGGVEAKRVERGEPADGAGDVGIAWKGFAAMAFEVDPELVVAGQSSGGGGKCGEQDVVDAGAVGMVDVVEQLCGAILVKEEMSRGFLLFLGIGFFGRVVATVDAGVVELQPVVMIAGETVAAGVIGEHRGPGLEAVGFEGQGGFLALSELVIEGAEVFEEDAPGEAVDDEVMDDQEEAVAVGQVEESRGEEGAGVQAEALLDEAGGVVEGFGGTGMVAEIELMQGGQEVFG